MAKENKVLSWENRHLTLESIESYNSRKLSELDMHKAERHILNCDLCADALEGYGQKAGDPKVRKNLETLRLQIRQKSERREKSGSTFKTWGIAASIVILLGFGLYYFQSSFLPTPEEPEIAMKQEQPIERPSQELLIVDDSEPVEEEPTTLDEDFIEADAESGQRAIPTQVPVPVQATPATKPAAGLEPDQALASNSDQILEVEETDAEEVEEERAPDPVPEEVGISRTEPTDVALLKEEGLKDAPQASVELAKSGTPEGGPALATSTGLSSGAKLGGSIMDSDPEPEIGFDDYGTYLQNSIEYPEEARLNNISGVVKIGFILKPGSTYSKFRIVEGLGYGCDKEAERLIQEGPNWKPAIRKGLATKEEVIVEVKFEL